MPILLIRDRHRRWARLPDQTDYIIDLSLPTVDAAVRPLQIDAPRGVQDLAGGFGLTFALLRRAIGPKFSAGQIAQSHAEASRGVQGDRPTEPNLDVVRMWTENEQVDGD